MRHLHLSDVQSTNLQLLHVILVGAQRDLVETCRKFHLHATQAERLRTMQPSEIWSLVHAVGDTSLFVPRNDFLALVDSPPHWPARSPQCDRLSLRRSNQSR